MTGHTTPSASSGRCALAHSSAMAYFPVLAAFNNVRHSTESVQRRGFQVGDAPKPENLGHIWAHEWGFASYRGRETACTPPAGRAWHSQEWAGAVSRMPLRGEWPRRE